MSESTLTAPQQDAGHGGRIVRGRDREARRQRAVYVALAGAALVLGGLVPSILAPTFWRPFGAVLFGTGLVAGAAGLAVRFTPHLLTLARRELAAYFLSPIAYMTLFGMSVIAAINFLVLVSILSHGGEPLRQFDQVVGFAYSWPSFCVLIVVPIATMRTFSEERRSGTIEVLLTAPVTEADVVLSKFLASLAFYMIAWLPWLFFLLVLRWFGHVEFDLGPALGAMIGLLVTGTTFVAGGMLLSSFTRSQIIAAILTFSLMLVLYLFVIIEQLVDEVWHWGQAYAELMRYLSFAYQLEEFGQGKIDLRFVMLHLSVAAVLLFVNIKVLESRSWR